MTLIAAVVLDAFYYLMYRTMAHGPLLSGDMKIAWAIVCGGAALGSTIGLLSIGKD